MIEPYNFMSCRFCCLISSLQFNLSAAIQKFPRRVSILKPMLSYTRRLSPIVNERRVHQSGNCKHSNDGCERAKTGEAPCGISGRALWLLLEKPPGAASSSFGGARSISQKQKRRMIIILKFILPLHSLVSRVARDTESQLQTKFVK